MGLILLLLPFGRKKKKRHKYLKNETPNSDKKKKTYRHKQIPHFRSNNNIYRDQIHNFAINYNAYKI